ncbi:aminodeoxychorismate lyase [Endozoicomonas ascidiicola]|uniref:aminodeoxychorismate lyase n=1 Tax=Endozoicomonas ascidiicola TaxID=1698521 RepID=UPI000AADE905|nr:aminodeoxychorismate lyase [Endozoicomonas ascidiicola]
MSTALIWVNGQPQSELLVSDRGLAYGDGLFETIRVSNGLSTLAALHWERLVQGCRRLAINLNLAELTREVDAFLASASVETGVLKVTVTRGSGGRGYNPEDCHDIRRILSIHSLPIRDPDPSICGAKLFACQLRLGQSALAGIKHLNRLEQVMARSEWSGTAYDEGLVCDFSGHVIEGTMSNLFVVAHNGELITPDLSFSGVKGVCRQFIMSIAHEMGLVVSERHLAESRLADIATELFLCNSVNGVWPVVEYNQRNWEVGPVTLELRRRVQEELNA